MKMNPHYRTGLLPALLLVLITACEKDISKETEGNTETIDTELVAATKKPGDNDKAMHRLLQSVKQATSKYHSTVQAIKAHYQPSDECVAIPGVGGMGYHWVNSSLVDPVFDPQKPEVLLYARDKKGHLRLVAVEYIVVKAGQQAPMFGDQPFTDGGTPLPVEHWSLHVWLYEPNPLGLFAPFNPNISCP